MTEATPGSDMHADAGGQFTKEERRALLFVEGAPDVAIGGLDLHRVTMTFDPDGDSSHTDAPTVQWHIAGLPQITKELDDTFLLMGDLLCRRAGWFVATTVVGHVILKHPERVDVSDLDAVNELGRILGGWASDVLYDYAADVARSMVAMSNQCKIDVPVLTPRPHFGTVSAGTLDQESDATSEVDASV